MAARRVAALADLRAVATECKAGFSDWEAAEGLAITDELRALFQPPAAASLAAAGMAAQSFEFLSVVPPELLSIILSQLDTRALACLAATCRLLWCSAPTPLLALPAPGLVETELRRRAQARSLHVGSSLPEETLPWVPYLLKRDFYDALRREAPLAVGYNTASLWTRKAVCTSLASGTRSKREGSASRSWGTTGDRMQALPLFMSRPRWCRRCRTRAS